MQVAIIKGNRISDNKSDYNYSTSIDFRLVDIKVKLNYCNIVLKTLLTEKILGLGLNKELFDKYKTNIDLINMVDNIEKDIDLSLFIGKNDKEHRMCLDNMIYNSINRAVLYLKTLYPEIDIVKFMNEFNVSKNDISINILKILSE